MAEIMTIRKLPSIAVLGPGGIGGFLAAVFCKAGFPVTCVATPDRVEQITKDGIHLESAMFGTFTAHPRAVDLLDATASPSDSIALGPSILFIAVKATTLNDAITRVDPEIVRGAVIIPLLNGIEHMEVLRRRFPGQIAAGTISMEAYEKTPGHVIHATSFARIRVAADDADLRERLRDAIALIAEAGLTTEIGASEARILWEKLVRLNALALMTTRYKKPIGEIRDNEQMRRELMQLVSEAVTVAAKEGAVIDVHNVMAHLDRLEPSQFSSLKRDIDQEKQSELDAIAGAIVRAGMCHGISCPTIAAFISAIEHDQAR